MEECQFSCMDLSDEHKLADLPRTTGLSRILVKPVRPRPEKLLYLT